MVISPQEASFNMVISPLKGAFTMVIRPLRDVVDSLCKELHHCSFSQGEVIVRQGEEGDHLFVLEQGRLEVLSKSRSLFYVYLSKFYLLEGMM